MMVGSINSMGDPQNGRFTTVENMENSIEMDDLGVPPFTETSSYVVVTVMVMKSAILCVSLKLGIVKWDKIANLIDIVCGDPV